MNGPDFETNCKRVAKLLWPSSSIFGSIVENGKERDGVYITEDCVHILECTTARTKEKAKKDIKKIGELLEKYKKEYPDKAKKGWFITQDEPTADQRAVLKEEKLVSSVNVWSFLHFQAKLIRAEEYFTARDNYKFGSVKDPKTGDMNPISGYLSLGLINPKNASVKSLNQIIDGLQAGNRFLIVGDYGAGKSMTFREIYFRLKERFRRGLSAKFPIHINLRDHNGQEDPHEIIERHARIIGFGSPHHLVRAWRGGFVTLLLDGFDELAPIGFNKSWKKLHELRSKALLGVRKLIDESTTDSGIILSGRAHYFDNDTERSNCLSIDKSFEEFTLSEFSESQIKEYLEKYGYINSIPAWLPKRPLLVGYLVSKNLLPELISATPQPAAAYSQGWDVLVSLISEREKSIESGINGESIRGILERLATKARKFSSGLGSFDEEIIKSSFKEVLSYPPDQHSMGIIQRLPGLGVENSIDTSRKFIDEELCDACRAGDIVKYILDPFNFDMIVFEDIVFEIGQIAKDIIIEKIMKGTIRKEALLSALYRLNQTSSADVAKLDLVSIVSELKLEVKEDIIIRDIEIRHFEVNPESPIMGRVIFHDCYFNTLSLHSDSSKNCPKFFQCYFMEIDGISAEQYKALPCFEKDCSVENFELDIKTSDQILETNIPVPIKVLLVSIKKLFLQKGTGRKESALFRGLSTNEQRYVHDVVNILESNGVVTPLRKLGGTIWLPNKSMREAANKILANPTDASNSVIAQCLKIN